MHADEVATDAALVRHLLATQHPQWADLPISRVASAGTDNAMYRLGDDLAVRLPRIHWAVDSVDKEQTWLPRLAPNLPLPVPIPIASGAADDRYPHRWGVVRWLDGQLATAEAVDSLSDVAHELATFVGALRTIDPAGGPIHSRGAPVRAQDDGIRSAVAALGDLLDVETFLAAWDRVLAAPDHTGPPTWFHGDLGDLNLLAVDGQLSAVIDWGTCGVGDPAVDCRIAWNLFGPAEREIYRTALSVDDATWERGKGWALSAVTGVGYYHETNPTLVEQALRGINAVLDDFRRARGRDAAGR